MAKGLKSFVEKETLTSLMDDTLDEFIDMLNAMTVKPTPQEAEKMLIPELRNRIDTRNNTADKTDQWKKPSTLLPIQIARVMCAIDNVRRIKFTSKSRNRDNDLLGLYQADGPNVGLYTYDESIIMSRIREYSSSLRLDGVKEVMGILRDIAPEAEKCPDRDLIPVNNGIFNYKTKELYEFTPEHVFLSKSWIDYNVNATNVHITMPDNVVWDCDSWMQSLTTDKEVLQLLYELISAELRPGVRWNKLILLYATSGNNGKGSFACLLRSILGEDAYASIPLSDFGKEFALAPLLHAQAIIVDENDVGTYVDKCAELKAIVTNDTIDINQKYRPVITMQYRGLVVECLNEFPRLLDHTNSMIRRLLIIPFDRCFTGVEREYIKDEYLQRQDVLEYFLKCALESNFYKLSEPKVCKQALDEFQISNDTVAEFWNEVKDQLVWSMQPLTWLYELYLKWFECTHPKSKTTPIPSRKFREKMVEIAAASDEWECRGIDTVVAKGKKHNLDGHEPLIDEYGVEKFMNPDYKGVDVRKKCNFVRKDTYKGCLLRKETKVGIVTDDKSDDED